MSQYASDVARFVEAMQKGEDEPFSFPELMMPGLRLLEAETIARGDLGAVCLVAALYSGAAGLENEASAFIRAGQGTQTAADLKLLEKDGGGLASGVLKHVRNGTVVTPSPFEQFKAILAEKVGIELLGTERDFKVQVKYTKSGWDSSGLGELASVTRSGAGWEICISIMPYFWGPDWQSKPMMIQADNLEQIGGFLLRTLGPRMDRNKVLHV